MSEMDFAERFPREVGMPQRVGIINNIDEYVTWINLYNTKANLYTSIFSFKEINGNKPIYSSAVVDKLFFDVDSKDFQDKETGAYNEMLKLHKYCTNKQLMHSVLFSGRGFHIYIYTKVNSLKSPKWALFNAQDAIQKELNLQFDTQVKGDLARIARIPGTLNLRSMRYCIPLTDQYLQGSENIKEIFELSQRQFFHPDVVHGKHRVDLNKFDTEPKMEFNIKLSEIDVKIGDDDMNKMIEYMPDCIKMLLLNKDCNYKQRFEIILFLKEGLGFSYNETVDILRKTLSERKFKHMLYAEKQVDYVYKRNDLFFPNCETLAAEGFCPHRCSKYPNSVYKKGEE